MKNEKPKNRRNQYIKLKKRYYNSYEHNVDLRKKSLSKIETSLNSSFSNLNTLLDKINNIKNLIVFNKYDLKDLKSVKILDKNALLFSKNMNLELKKTSDLLFAYNLGSFELDNFVNKLTKKNKKNKKEKINFVVDFKKKGNPKTMKKEFDLANTGKNKKEKMKNNDFLKNESKMRDLYNLKLELFFKKQKKKISENKYYEEVKKRPFCVREKKKSANSAFSSIKSKYYDLYKLPQSFEIEEDMREAKLLNEIEKSYEENETYKITNSRESLAIKNKHASEPIQSNQKDIQNYNSNENNIKTNFDKTKKKINLILTQRKENNFMEKMKNRIKPSSAHISKINKNNFIESFSFNNISQRNINTYKTNKSINLKKTINYRPNSGNAFNRNSYNINNNKYNKFVFVNYRNINRRNKSLSHNDSKQTFYSSTASTSKIPAFSFIKNNSPNDNFKNKNKSAILEDSLNLKEAISSKLKRKSFFTNYVKQINKIINYSNYATNKFKQSSNLLKKKNLFQKSNSEIFETNNNIDIEKINKSLKLEKNRHSFINEKKLIYNNSKKVKLMLTQKNRKILNTILMELMDKQRRVNGFYKDLSYFEKAKQKHIKRQRFKNLANETIYYEKKFDKEAILDMFQLDENKIVEYLKEIREKYNNDEEEWKHIILKHKNMVILERTNMKKKAINGNIYKRRLLSKFKNERK